MAYLYRHIRLDKNQVFYIGISGKDDNYSRAKSTFHRNKIWKNIVNKSKYRIEILFDNISIEEAKLKEIEFIELYGRINNNTGVLANLTNGGDGTNGVIRSNETRSNISKSKMGFKNPMFGKNFSKIHRYRLSQSRCGAKHPRARIVFDQYGGFFYDTLNDASFAMNMKRRTLHAMLTGQNKNKTNLIFV